MPDYETIAAGVDWESLLPCRLDFLSDVAKRSRGRGVAGVAGFSAEWESLRNSPVERFTDK